MQAELDIYEFCKATATEELATAFAFVCYCLMPRFNSNNNINIATWPGFGYTHETVNHQENFVDPVTGANIRRIECHYRATSKPNWSGACVERRKLCCPPIWQNTGGSRCTVPRHSMAFSQKRLPFKTGIPGGPGVF